MPKASSSKTTTATRAAASSSPSKSPAKRSPKKTTSEPVDESSWPQSILPTGQKINKTRAKDLYRLKDEDLEALDVEHAQTVKTIRGQRVITPMLLYRERDVERAAWRKNGGPQGFREMLDKLKARHDKMQEKKSPAQRKPFAAPDSYSDPDGRGTVRLIKLGPPPTDEERWTRTPRLLALRQQFTPWVWAAVNRYLDRRDDEMLEGCILGFPPGWRDEREAIVKLALQHLHYPPRPLNPLPSSPSIDKLREVLTRAPHRRGRYEELDGSGSREEPDGIDSDEDYEGNYSVWWSNSYLQDLFPALVDVVREHGVGEQGWQTVRWEVYDKYVECIGGIEYVEDGRDSRWIDNANAWLCGRTTHPLLGCQDRTSSLGDEYNSLLPVTDYYGRLN